VASHVPHQQARSKDRAARVRQFRQRVLATRQVPAGRTTEGGQARRTVGAGVEDARPRDRALLGPADRRRRRLCAARYADPALDAQKQVASQCLQVRRLDCEHRFRRFRPARPALDHSGADLVPLVAVPVAVGAVPQRSFHLPVLDLHHRHGFPLGPRPVLWLAVSVRLTVRAALQGGQCGRPQAFPVCRADGSAQPAEMGEVRGVLRPAGGVRILDGAGGKACRGRTVQDHLPRRPVQPQLALHPVCRWLARPLDLHRAAVLQVSLPARRGAGDADDLSLVRAQAQTGVRHLPRLRERLRLATRSTPTAASIHANACYASTAWCCTPTPTPARR
jgi:hypothetical protein